MFPLQYIADVQPPLCEREKRTSDPRWATTPAINWGAYTVWTAVTLKLYHTWPDPRAAQLSCCNLQHLRRGESECMRIEGELT
jgi:hypothetical protein